MVGRSQHGYIKGPYYMVKPGPMPTGEHNEVESKKLHKLGRFPKLRAAGRAAGAAGKAFSLTHLSNRDTSRIASSAINRFRWFFRFNSRRQSMRGPNPKRERCVFLCPPKGTCIRRNNYLSLARC